MRADTLGVRRAPLPPEMPITKFAYNIDCCFMVLHLWLKTGKSLYSTAAHNCIYISLDKLEMNFSIIIDCVLYLYYRLYYLVLLIYTPILMSYSTHIYNIYLDPLPDKVAVWPQWKKKIHFSRSEYS